VSLVQHKAQWASERGVRSLTRMKRSMSDLPPETGFLVKNGVTLIAIFASKIDFAARLFPQSPFSDYASSLVE
jgi:hypothetical protein